jgi:hypothetical protein
MLRVVMLITLQVPFAARARGISDGGASVGDRADPAARVPARARWVRWADLALQRTFFSLRSNYLVVWHPAGAGEARHQNEKPRLSAMNLIIEPLSERAWRRVEKRILDRLQDGSSQAFATTRGRRARWPCELAVPPDPCDIVCCRGWIGSSSTGAAERRPNRRQSMSCAGAAGRSRACGRPCHSDHTARISIVTTSRFSQTTVPFAPVRGRAVAMYGSSSLSARAALAIRWRARMMRLFVAGKLASVVAATSRSDFPSS